MRDLKIIKLSDEFGQYVLLLTCTACNHTRRAYPASLAAFAGWEAKLDDVVKRMRCTKCRERKCVARAMREVAPRKYKSH
jgi:hypothetical protein